VEAIEPLPLSAAARRPLPAIQRDHYWEILSRDLPTGAYDTAVAAYELANQLNAEIQRRAEREPEATVTGRLGSEANEVQDVAQHAEELLRRALPR
jgi:hypothetical protein